MAGEAESVRLDLATPKPWRRWIPAWLRSLIWVDFADRYDAFLSYSWKADSKTTPVIHSVLQRFLCPWYKRRAKTIFRDLSCLPAGSNLQNELFDRMDRSTHLIVLASPEAARSVGMEMEARHWFSRPRDGQVLIIVTEGDFDAWDDIRDQTLPATIRSNLASQPLWIPLQHRCAEILASSNRPMLRAQLIEDLKQIFLRLHAPRTWEELHGEERAQRRRALWTIWAVASVFLVLAVAAVRFGIDAQRQSKLAQQRQQQAEAARDAETKARLAETQLTAGINDLSNTSKQVQELQGQAKQAWTEYVPKEAWCYQERDQPDPNRFSVYCHWSEDHCNKAKQGSRRATACALVPNLDTANWTPSPKGLYDSWYQLDRDNPLPPPFPQFNAEHSNVSQR